VKFATLDPVRVLLRSVQQGYNDNRHTIRLARLTSGVFAVERLLLGE
jgi:hypothetical protein